VGFGVSPLAQAAFVVVRSNHMLIAGGPRRKAPKSQILVKREGGNSQSEGL